ncbi:hypothetical protein QE152_g32239 [Popillia japonica]|uniref:Uncharacterized protein n=1 Tax=Popillia japonica TaxID=7064 RepID=A0AAW1IZJ7_POPJA
MPVTVPRAINSRFPTLSRRRRSRPTTEMFEVVSPGWGTTWRSTPDVGSYMLHVLGHAVHRTVTRFLQD